MATQVATRLDDHFESRVRSTGMKLMWIALLASLALTSCYGPGGPATRAGRAVDHAVSHVGEGIERTGDAIQDAAN
jgi:hypothetical protein